MDELYSALIDIIRQESSPEAVKARNMILRRAATESDVTRSRIPAPLNITQIGGYINLLEHYGFNDLSYSMLASTLGLPVNHPEAVLYDAEPVLYFSSLPSDRPACAQEAFLPLTYAMRNDFAMVMATALKTVHEAGAALPLMSARRSLPALNAPLPTGKQTLEIIGRTLEIAPGAALIDPCADPVIITREDDERVSLYALAARGVSAAVYDAFAFDAGTGGLKTVTVEGKYLPLLPVLARAGWYPQPDAAAYPAQALKLTNITGLTPGVTAYGDELSMLYTRQQIVASSVRDMYDRVWDGQAFAGL